MPAEPVPVGSTAPVLLEPPAVLAAALEAYFAFDGIGRVLAWNPAVEKRFGYTRAQA